MVEVDEGRGRLEIHGKGKRGVGQATGLRGEGGLSGLFKRDRGGWPEKNGAEAGSEEKKRGTRGCFRYEDGRKKAKSWVARADRLGWWESPGWRPRLGVLERKVSKGTNHDIKLAG